MNRKTIDASRNQEYLFFLWYFGFRKNKDFRGQSYKGIASSPACSFSSAASIIMHSFLQISSMCIKNNLLPSKIFESKAGTKVSLLQAQSQSVWWPPKSQISHILVQSQSTCTMLKTLTTKLNMEKFSRKAKLHLTRGEKTSMLNDRKPCKCANSSPFPERTWCGVSSVKLLSEGLSKINLHL